MQTFGVDVVARALAPVGAVTPAVRRSCVTDVFDPALKAAALGVVDTGVNTGVGPGVNTGVVGATGVTELDATDALPVPATFVAVTVNIYAVPLVRPVTVQERAPVVVHVRPPGLAVTVYPVIGQPPSDTGAVHDTTLCASAPLVAETLVGTPGCEAKIVALPPGFELSPDAPTITVLPSLDNATESPKNSFASPPVWVIVCCCVHVALERVKIVALP